MITSYTDVGYICITDYTFDREFYVATTNTPEKDCWETCVFCNDPTTDIREFESLVEMVHSNSEESAKLTHQNLLRKWDVLATNKDPTWLGSHHSEDTLGIGEGLH